jgi:hypothetical protein
MIMQGTTPRALTWGGVLGLLGLGAFLLPVAPSWAQEEGDPLRVQVVRPGAGDATPKATNELDALKADLARKRAELERAEAELKAAQERMSRAAAGGAKVVEAQGVIVLELVDGDKRQVIRLPAGSRVLKNVEPPKKAEGSDVRAVEDAVRKKVAEAMRQQAEAVAAAQTKAKRVIIEIVSDGKRQVIELPPGSRVINDAEMSKGVEFKWEVKPGQPAIKFPGAGAEVKPAEGYRAIMRPAAPDTEKRLADLEKRLEDLMRSVKELRGELNRAKPNVPKPPVPPALPGRQAVPGEEGQSNSFFLPVAPAPVKP